MMALVVEVREEVMLLNEDDVVAGGAPRGGRSMQPPSDGQPAQVHAAAAQRWPRRTSTRHWASPRRSRRRRRGQGRRCGLALLWDGGARRCTLPLRPLLLWLRGPLAAVRQVRLVMHPGIVVVGKAAVLLIVQAAQALQPPLAALPRCCRALGMAAAPARGGGAHTGGRGGLAAGHVAEVRRGTARAPSQRRHRAARRDESVCVSYRWSAR